MAQRAHPALIGPNHFSHNRFYDEADAAHYWGIDLDEWVWKSRGARAAMTAYTRLAKVVEAIGSYDRSQFVKHNPHLFK